MKTAKVCLTSVLIFIVCAWSVNATLLERDYLSAGDSLLTFDTETGYEWLDLTVTLNMSVNSVLVELTSGGQFEGFSMASSEQFFDLVASGGSTLVPGTYITSDQDIYNTAF